MLTLLASVPAGAKPNWFPCGPPRDMLHVLAEHLPDGAWVFLGLLLVWVVLACWKGAAAETWRMICLGFVALDFLALSSVARAVALESDAPNLFVTSMGLLIVAGLGTLLSVARAIFLGSERRSS